MERLKGNSREVYSELRARPPVIIRADGRGFRKILENFEKPYDEGFARSMASGTARLFEESGLTPDLAFLFSDEISLLFTDLPFGGRIEKLDSVIPSFLSGALSLELGRVVSMDARVIPFCPSEISDYLGERQDETWRNHVFSYGFYSLVNEGKTPEESMKVLRGMSESEIHEFMFRRGVNLARTPAWQRRGTLVYRKNGRVFQDWDVPLFRSEEGLKLLSDITGISDLQD